MPQITLQFCSFKSPFGLIIPWFTQGPVGHVDAVCDDGSLLGAQYASGLGGRPAGVQIRPKDYGDSCGMTKRVRFTILASQEQHDTFWVFLQAQLGKPYDDTAIAAFVAGRDWHDPSAWICSELQAEATNEAQLFPCKFWVPANCVTPNALAFAWSAFAPAEHGE
jgi:hypothetical protein